MQPRNKRRRALWIALALVAGLPLAFYGWLHTSSGHAAALAWASRYGFHGLDQQLGLVEALLRAPGKLLRSSAPPRLSIALEPRHLQAIERMRAAALKKGLIEADEQKKVAGTLRVGGATFPVELRLKGDYTDHLAHEKWSLRIAIEGAGEFAGMRQFSLQDPRTKGFQGEVLFYATLRWLGVLAPRYRFARVDFCGRDFGIMAVEEHVAKELLESQGRRDGAVVHLDEAMLFHGLDDYRQASVEAFGAKRLRKDPALGAAAANATTLLRAFVDGTASAHDVFAIEPLAGFLAAAQFWGCWHGQRWHNLRFYLDPVLQRLEPVGYDANLQMRRALPSVVALEEDLVMRLLADDAVYAAYERRLQALCDGVRDGSLLQVLRAAEGEALADLQGEYWLLEPLPAAEIDARARFFAGPRRPSARTGSGGYLGPQPLCAYEERSDGEATVELRNGSTDEIVVTGLSWVARAGKERSLPFVPVAPAALPVVVPPRTPQGRGAATVRGLPSPDPALGSLEVESRRGGRTSAQRAVRDPAPDGVAVLPQSSVAAQLAAHAFLRRTDDGHGLVIGPGEHRVDGLLIVPPGVELTVMAGAVLHFAAGAALVAHGPVQLRGEAGMPVRLLPVQDRWLGVAVLHAGATCRWQHVEIAGTSGVNAGNWQLTGAVTFAQTDCELDHCRFERNDAEDALNVIHAAVALRDCEFRDTASDAFDGDFVTGSVTGCVFERIGGDAVDVSGSDIEIADVVARDVRDKALSIGERSRARARGLVAERVGTGAASKDGSELVLAGARIEAAVAGLLAYTKKPECGPATLIATDLRVNGPAPRARAQLGSRVRVDGQEVAAEPIDVERLYATVMRK